MSTAEAIQAKDMGRPGLEEAAEYGQHVDDIDLPHLLEDAPGILSLGELTPHVKHAFDDGTDEGGITEDDKLEAIARDECDVLAGLWKVHAGGCPGSWRRL